MSFGFILAPCLPVWRAFAPFWFPFKSFWVLFDPFGRQDLDRFGLDRPHVATGCCLASFLVSQIVAEEFSNRRLEFSDRRLECSNRREELSTAR